MPFNNQATRSTGLLQLQSAVVDVRRIRHVIQPESMLQWSTVHKMRSNVHGSIHPEERKIHGSIKDFIQLGGRNNYRMTNSAATRVL
jgi:hypothetical protein